VNDSVELAELLTERTWTLCTGFRHTTQGQTILLLNDITGENGAQEYGVFLPDGRQIESVTFGWCDQHQAERILRGIVAGRRVSMGTHRLLIDDDPNHLCHLCR